MAGGRPIDCTVGKLVLEHLDHLAPIFGEAARVLKPSGSCFLCELHLERYTCSLVRRSQ